MRREEAEELLLTKDKTRSNVRFFVSFLLFVSAFVSILLFTKFEFRSEENSISTAVGGKKGKQEAPLWNPPATYQGKRSGVFEFYKDWKKREGFWSTCDDVSLDCGYGKLGSSKHGDVPTLPDSFHFSDGVVLLTQLPNKEGPKFKFFGRRQEWSHSFIHNSIGLSANMLHVQAVDKHEYILPPRAIQELYNVIKAPDDHQPSGWSLPFLWEFLRPLLPGGPENIARYLALEDSMKGPPTPLSGESH